MDIRAIAVIGFAVLTIFGADRATAHPLGNFSISHYSAIRIGKDAVELRYIIDMAEIPTFQEIQENRITVDADDVNLQAYLTRKAEILRDGLSLQVGGKSLRLQLDSREIIFPPGAGDLPTMKIGMLFKAKLDGASMGEEQSLDYRDGNFPGRAGWKEIIAVADAGLKLTHSSVPGTDRSRQLSDYPTDLLNSPPQQLEARINFTVGTVSPAELPVRSPISVAKTTLSDVRAVERNSTAGANVQGRHKLEFCKFKRRFFRPTRSQQANDAAQFVHGDYGNQAARLGNRSAGARRCRRPRRVSRP